MSDAIVHEDRVRDALVRHGYAIVEGIGEVHPRSEYLADVALRPTKGRTQMCFRQLSLEPELTLPHAKPGDAQVRAMPKDKLLDALRQDRAIPCLYAKHRSFTRASPYKLVATDGDGDGDGDDDQRMAPAAALTSSSAALAQADVGVAVSSCVGDDPALLVRIVHRVLRCRSPSAASLPPSAPPVFGLFHGTMCDADQRSSPWTAWTAWTACTLAQAVGDGVDSRPAWSLYEKIDIIVIVLLPHAPLLVFLPRAMERVFYTARWQCDARDLQFHAHNVPEMVTMPKVLAKAHPMNLNALRDHPRSLLRVLPKGTVPSFAGFESVFGYYKRGDAFFNVHIEQLSVAFVHHVVQAQPATAGTLFYLVPASQLERLRSVLVELVLERLEATGALTEEAKHELERDGREGTFAVRA
jgi:hypothetical protein